MTAALAREVTCTDCGKTFPGRVGGTRRCGPCAQHRVAEALRARRGDVTAEVASAAPVPEAPFVSAVLPGAGFPVVPELTCADCGTTFTRKDSRGVASTRCVPCQTARDRESRRAWRAAETKTAAEARAMAGPAPYTPAVSDRAAQVSGVLAERMLTAAPACAGDDRFTAEPSSLAPGAESDMLRLCRSCPLLEPCAAVAKTTKPAAGFWAGKHRSTRTRATEEVTA